MLDRVCICLYMFACVCFQKIQKRKLTGSSAQNIFGDPRYSQVSPWVSVGFPGKKRSIGLRCRPPHACIHLEKFMYPLALVSCAPTNNTFPASGTHTCLILRGYPPLVPIHFWQKVRGLTPPLCSYIIRNVGSTPPTPEPVGVGDGFYPQRLLHTDAFTHRDFYTHRRFYTQTDAFTQTLSHAETVTDRRFDTQTLLHTEAFTQTLLHTETFTHTDAFTHRRFYTQTLLHTDAFYTQTLFTHRRFDAQTHLHTEALHTNTFTQTLLHTNTFTHRRFYTQTL